MCCFILLLLLFFKDTASPEIYTYGPTLPDTTLFRSARFVQALPETACALLDFGEARRAFDHRDPRRAIARQQFGRERARRFARRHFILRGDRKSTRLNSSH